MHGWKVTVLLGLLLVAAAAGGGGATARAVTTRSWTGAVNSNWTNAGNWSPAGAPVNGDTVVIAADGAHITGVPAGLNLAALILGATLEISGGPLKISSAITVTRENIAPTLDLALELSGNVQVSVPVGAGLGLRRHGSPLGTVAVTLGGYTLTKVNGGDEEFNGDVVGPGTLAATGGQLSILYPLTFGGIVSLGPGTIGYLTERGGTPVRCGSAPGAKFVLTSASLGTGCRTSVGILSGSGNLYVDLRFAIVGSGETFDGAISGPSYSAFYCCALGVQTLRGESKGFAGSIYVTGGSLLFDGAAFPLTTSVSVQGSGNFSAGLGGYGTFGEAIMANAYLDLASIDGKFGLARFGFLQLAPDVTVQYEIKGGTPGIGFTQIAMSGDVFLGSAWLGLDFKGYQPPAGQALTLIKGATALSGTFHAATDGSNLPEGASFTVAGMQFTITYKGGAGHDVVITRQAAAATPAPSPPKFRRYVPMVVRES